MAAIAPTGVARNPSAVPRMPITPPAAPIADTSPGRNANPAATVATTGAIGDRNSTSFANADTNGPPTFTAIPTSGSKALPTEIAAFATSNTTGARSANRSTAGPRTPSKSNPDNSAANPEPNGSTTRPISGVMPPISPFSAGSAGWIAPTRAFDAVSLSVENNPVSVVACFAIPPDRRSNAGPAPDSSAANTSVARTAPSETRSIAPAVSVPI